MCQAKDFSSGYFKNLSYFSPLAPLFVPFSFPFRSLFVPFSFPFRFLDSPSWAAVAQPFSPVLLERNSVSCRWMVCTHARGVVVIVIMVVWLEGIESVQKYAKTSSR
jgi:hypothetical protein